MCTYMHVVVCVCGGGGRMSNVVTIPGWWRLGVRSVGFYHDVFVDWSV